MSFARGLSFVEYSFVEQMQILGEFFEDTQNLNNDILFNLHQFYKNNRTKSFVAKKNAKNYKSLIEDIEVLKELDDFINGAR